MKIIILACLYFLASINADSDVDVIGGSDSVPHAHPWQVSLQREENGVWTHKCGGSLISEDRVVTAGHCIEDVIPIQNSRVVAGEHDLTKNEGTEQIQRIKWAIEHPKFDLNTIDWDYAVITTVGNFTLNKYVQTIELGEVGVIPQGRCNATGWGVFKQPGINYPNILQQIDFPYVPRSNCSDIYSAVDMKITERMICAGGEPNRGLCRGDSGGPFVCEGENGKYLAGSASFVKNGSDCVQDSFPVGFSNVPLAREWLLNDPADSN